MQFVSLKLYKEKMMNLKEILILKISIQSSLLAQKLPEVELQPT